MIKGSLFITRSLRDDSPFLKDLPGNVNKVLGRSMVTFTAVSFELPSEGDWLFFYSANGVRFFAEQCLGNPGFNWSAFKIGAMGRGTARSLKESGVTVDFEGNGFPETVAGEFLKVAKGEKVIFLGARRSKNSIQVLLEKQIQSKRIVVYDNQPSGFSLKENPEYIIFTSPLNVEAFLQYNSVDPNQKIIAIGPTTGKKLKSYGIEQFHIPSFPTEISIVNYIRTLENLP